MFDLHIREAALTDVLGIIRVRKQATENVMRQEVTAEMLYRALQLDCKGYVAVSHDQIVGFCIGNKRRGSIWGLFVLPSYQGIGLGEQLLETTTHWLWKQKQGFFRKKLKRITLTTHKDAKSEEFYQHLGWQRGQELPDEEVEYFIERTV